MITGHGDDLYRYDGKVKMNFSSNLPQFADLSALKAYLADRLDVISSYPEPEATKLEGLLAERLGVPASGVMVTAGATEAIYLIAQLYRGWASVIPQPTFSEYDDACRMHGHIVSYDDENRERLPEKRIYWLCNPNNPTGNVMLKALLNHLVRTKPQYMFVIDQSYETLTLMDMLQPREMADCQNLILIHSMSKQYCIPGLRLSYITGAPGVIAQLRRCRQPWTVNAIAIEAGKFLTANDIEVLPDRRGYLEEARRLHTELNSLAGIRLMDSAANFMLAYLENGRAASLKRWLIDEHGILVRNASNFRGLNNHYFRVSAQTSAENDALVAAVRAYLQNYK